MDLTLTPTRSADDTENDTPPHTTNNLLSFTTTTTTAFNNRPMPPRHSVSFPMYKECMKNHAAAIGGHAVDGCGEFISHDSTSTSFKCAACGCHRNFHRRETHAPPPPMPHFLDFRRPSPPRITYGLHALTTAVEVADDHNQAPATPIGESSQVGRKRSRTKFTQEQREKMQCFSEKLGWRMQKCDVGLVEEFCSEVGVKRSVLKVWMHNNKNTIGKKEVVGNGNGGVVIEFGGRKSDNGSCSSD